MILNKEKKIGYWRWLIQRIFSIRIPTKKALKILSMPTTEFVFGVYLIFTGILYAVKYITDLMMYEVICLTVVFGVLVATHGYYRSEVK